MRSESPWFPQSWGLNFWDDCEHSDGRKSNHMCLKIIFARVLACIMEKIINGYELFPFAHAGTQGDRDFGDSAVLQNAIDDISSGDTWLQCAATTFKKSVSQSWLMLVSGCWLHNEQDNGLENIVSAVYMNDPISHFKLLGFSFTPRILTIRNPYVISNPDQKKPGTTFFGSYCPVQSNLPLAPSWGQHCREGNAWHQSSLAGTFAKTAPVGAAGLGHISTHIMSSTWHIVLYIYYSYILYYTCI